MTTQILFLAMFLIQFLTRADDSKVYYRGDFTTKPVISESFASERFTIVIWFRVKNYQIDNQPMLEIIGRDVAHQIIKIMRFWYHPLRISVQFEKEVKYIEYDQDAWSQLLIENQQNNIYDKFTITIQTNSLQQTITRQQLRNTFHQLMIEFSAGEIQYTQIQISNSKLIQICQPGCKICHDNLFECQVCLNYHVLQNQNEYCDCPLFWNQVSSSQCLKDQLAVYERINKQVPMSNILAKLEDKPCQNNVPNIIATLSLYELDQIKKLPQIDVIYIQIDDSRSLEWYQNTYVSIKFVWSLIFSLNLEYQIYSLTQGLKHYEVQNVSAIHRHSNCIDRSNIQLTVIGLQQINQNISETLFYQKNLKIIDFKIQNSNIFNSILFNSETIIIYGFTMLNCTLNNSLILFAQVLEMKDIKIKNCRFINSSLISSKLSTLLIMNLLSDNIISVGNSNFINIIEGQQLEFTNIYSNDCLFQAGFLMISGTNITITNITFQNINQFNYQLFAIINIYAYNLQIVNLMLDTIQGEYQSHLLCLQSNKNQSTFEIYNLTIKSFEVQITKSNNLIYIKQLHGTYTLMQNLIVDNITVISKNILFYIITTQLHLKDGSLVSDSQSGFIIQAFETLMQRIVFSFHKQYVNSNYFITLKSNHIKIAECRFIQSAYSLILIYLIYPQMSSYFYLQDSEIQNQQTVHGKRFFIEVEDIAKVYIQRCYFSTPFQVMPALFSIFGTQNTLVSDCIIDHITYFMSIQQFNESSEIIFINLKVDNICVNQDLQLPSDLLKVFQGQVKIRDFQIAQACNPISLDQITSLLIDGYRANQITVYSALISVISFHDLSINISNSFFEDILIKSDLGRLINLKTTKAINLVMSSIYLNKVRSDTNHHILVQISPENLSATINQLIFKDCQCSHRCILLQNIFGSLIIDNSTFIRNELNEFISISNSDKHIDIYNSLFIYNEIQDIGGIYSNCEFLYNDLYDDLDIDKLKSSFNRVLDYPTDIQVMLSTNGGLQYSINSRLSKNKFEIKLKNGDTVTNQFYIPTGQPFDNFILFNQQSSTYQEQSIKQHYSIKNVSDNAYCTLEYMNKSIEFQLLSQNWDSFMVISKPNTIIKFLVICSVQGVDHSLEYYGKTMECQLGEFIYMNKCIRCLPELFQYSVQKKSQFCKPIDIRTMKQVNYGLLNLYDGYWRPNIYSDHIELCIESQNSCNGGFKVGNELCEAGYLGAICSDCDSGNIQGKGSFIKNSLNKCQLCNFEWSDIFKFCFYAFLSAYFIFSNTKQFYDILRQRKIDLLVKKKTHRFAQASERTGIYIQFLLQYFQIITNTNNYSIVSLIPFQFRPNIFDNASFSYMNYVDCFISPYFNSQIWLYLRLFFLLICYFLILYLYFLLYFIMLKISHVRYSFFMIFIPIVNLYQNNIISYLSQQILFLSKDFFITNTNRLFQYDLDSSQDELTIFYIQSSSKPCLLYNSSIIDDSMAPDTITDINQKNVQLNCNQNEMGFNILVPAIFIQRELIPINLFNKTIFYIDHHNCLFTLALEQCPNHNFDGNGITILFSILTLSTILIISIQQLKNKNIIDVFQLIDSNGHFRE